MVLDLDDLVEYWGNSQLTPMLLVSDTDHISWRNRWADWLFRLKLGNNDLGQLQTGETLADYADKVRKYNAPTIINVCVNGLPLDVEGRMMGEESSHLMMKFHTLFLSRATMLEMHKFMQDFALETGDRVNNPLTTVMNCLNMIQRDFKEGNLEKIQTYLELAIREAYVMKEFGDWVRRLSEEPPSQEDFNLPDVLRTVLDRRNCLNALDITGEIPLVWGNAEHAQLVLGGLVNLMRQASGNKPFSVKVTPRDENLITVEINSSQSRVKDLRMLSEEFYGGLGLLAARYLLSLMQAQLELEYNGDVGIRVTFISANALLDSPAG